MEGTITSTTDAQGISEVTEAYLIDRARWHIDAANRILARVGQVERGRK